MSKSTGRERHREAFQGFKKDLCGVGWTLLDNKREIVAALKLIPTSQGKLSAEQRSWNQKFQLSEEGDVLLRKKSDGKKKRALDFDEAFQVLAANHMVDHTNDEQQEHGEPQPKRRKNDDKAVLRRLHSAVSKDFDISRAAVERFLQCCPGCLDRAQHHHQQNEALQPQFGHFPEAATASHLQGARDRALVREAAAVQRADAAEGKVASLAEQLEIARKAESAAVQRAVRAEKESAVLEEQLKAAQQTIARLRNELQSQKNEFEKQLVVAKQITTTRSVIGRIPLDGKTRIRVPYEDGEYEGVVVGYDHTYSNDERYLVLFDDGDNWKFGEEQILEYAVEGLLPKPALDRSENAGTAAATAGTEEEASAPDGGVGLDAAWGLKEAWCERILEYWREKDAARQFLKKNKHLGFDLDEQLGKARIKVHINRSQAAVFVLEDRHFASARQRPEISVFRRLEVQFTNGGKGKDRVTEDGLDADGLSRELNALFWEQVQEYVTHDSSFEAQLPRELPSSFRGPDGNGLRLFALEGGACLPTPFVDSNGDPLALTDALREKYRRVGNFLLRAFMNGWNVPSSFTPNIVLDYIQNLDLQYLKKDPSEITADICAVDPSFVWIENLVSAVKRGEAKVVGDLLGNSDSTPLKSETLKDALKAFVQERLLGPRQSAMEAIMNGFILQDSYDRPVFSTLPLMDVIASPAVRRLLISGDENCSAEKILEATDWKGYRGPRAGQEAAAARTQLAQALARLGSAGRGRFLRFATASAALGRGRLTVRPHPEGGRDAVPGGRRPEAATCARTVYLPRYADADQLFRRLEEAVRPEHAAFGRS